MTGIRIVDMKLPEAFRLLARLFDRARRPEARLWQARIDDGHHADIVFQGANGADFRQLRSGDNYDGAPATFLGLCDGEHGVRLSA